jgi:LacI family transcriptional regulator
MPRSPRRSHRRRATIVDVARVSGVSKSTVANVINGSAPFSDETRDRVLAAIDELGYRPNALARDLKRRRTATIGVIVGDLSNPFFGELTRLIERYAGRAGYATIICDTDGGDASERDKLGVLLEHRVAGVLLLKFSGDKTQIAEVERDGIPIVGVSVLDRGFDCVASDDAKGARLAVAHLADLGHERIAYVPSVDTEPSTTNARLRGWKQGLERAGLPRAPVVAIEAPRGGRRVSTLGAVLDAPDPPTAYVAGNDLTALDLIDQLESAGFGVPKDASVIGFDDIAFAGLRRLSLTTIRQPIGDLAKRGVSRLLERVDGADEGEASLVRVRLPVELIERGTTAPPP